MTEALIKTGIDVPQNILKIVCMIIVTILLSYVSLLFGELVPRRLGMKIRMSCLCVWQDFLRSR